MVDVASLPDPFFLRNTGDGWWDCPSPLYCTVLDGPDICGAFEEIYPLSSSGELYWLVEVEPPIVWNGNHGYAEMWGPDNALCHPFETTRALVRAREEGGNVGLRRRADSPDDWEPVPEFYDLDGDDGVAYPVVPGASSVRAAVPMVSLGIKASVDRRVDPKG